MTPMKHILTLVLACAATAVAAQPELKPFKDRQFTYGEVLATEDGGAYRLIDYSEARDIDQRDEVPEKRVKPDYVSLGVRKVEADLVVRTPVGPVAHVAVGRVEKASAIVIYLHGQGGNRRQGSDDFTFGGNFNRLKNLVAEAGGLYLSPDFADFGRTGKAQVMGLIAHYASRSPSARLVIACGSAGGQLCWALAKDRQAAALIDGYVLLGSLWDEDFLTSAAFAARAPIFFAHGSRDKVFPLERQAAFFRSILKRQLGYPARFVAFEGGTHGTPIRMTDWRETLNWIFAAR